MKVSLLFAVLMIVGMLPGALDAKFWGVVFFGGSVVILLEGQRVEYALVEGQKGLQAEDVLGL